MTDYGLPEPDHRLLEAHPTVSSELLPRIGHGDIAVKPNIDRFAGGRTVRFADGSEEEVDLVVYCTGYRIKFPFFDARVFAGARQPHAALQAGRLGRAPGALLHRLHPAAGADHAARRGAGRMGRRPARRARRRYRAAAEMREEIGDGGDEDAQALRRPRSGIRSRSTSTPTCARSGASESGLREPASDDPGAARRGGQSGQRQRGAAAVRARGAGRGAGAAAAAGASEPPSRPRGRRARALGSPTRRARAPSTGIFSTTRRKKIGRTPSIVASVDSRSLRRSRSRAQAVSASISASSRPRCGSVGTSSVGSARPRAHS